VDTAIVLNNKTFNSYKKAYNTNLIVLASLGKIKKQIDSVEILKNQLDAKWKADYKTLNDTLSNVIKVSKEMSTKQETNLATVNSSLASAQQKLTETVELLNSAEKNLKEARKNAAKKALTFGAGGLIIGLVVGVLAH
jgi:myosin heavy subunit